MPSMTNKSSPLGLSADNIFDTVREPLLVLSADLDAILDQKAGDSIIRLFTIIKRVCFANQEKEGIFPSVILSLDIAAIFQQ